MALMEDITKVARQVIAEAEHLVGQAVKQAGELTDSNRHKIGDAIDKAGKFVDSKTDGKFSKQVEQAKGAASKGVDFVAKQKAAFVPPRPGSKPTTVTDPQSPGAAWSDTSTSAAPPVGDTPYPNPIPSYDPPKS